MSATLFVCLFITPPVRAAARNRQLTVRYERRDDIHQAFLDLVCSFICSNQLQRLCYAL
jgi:hypothetical protein